jgi:hypothetical protein
VKPIELTTQRWVQGSGLRLPVGPELFTAEGTLLGTDEVNSPGIFPGCWDYRNFVYVSLRVVKG